MNKHILNTALAIGAIGLMTQCQQPTQTGSATTEPVEQMESDPATPTTLYAVLEADSALRLQDSLMIGFKVVNPTTDTLQFTVYHTPFEGFISKFLTVTDGEGKEVDYIGAMAKRVMPPPADSYHTLAPGQDESVMFDLKKGYKIENAGTYTLQYNSERINDIANGEPITITVVE